MDSHDLPTSVYLLMFGGAILSIAGLFLFLKWISRHDGPKPQSRRTSDEPQYRRKKGGRKRYR